MIISLVNSKGGVGKSTIAGSLAVWLHEKGQSVVLVDCDPQHSSSEWIAEATPDVPIHRCESAEDVFSQLPELRSDADYVVCDGPGSQTEINRALLMWTDLALIPCKASMFEARALGRNTRFVRRAQELRYGRPEAVVVLSMVGRRYRLTRDMKDAAGALGLKLARHALTLRQAYADAPGQASVVWRMGAGGQGAASEIESLFGELFPTLARDYANVVDFQQGRDRLRASESS